MCVPSVYNPDDLLLLHNISELTFQKQEIVEADDQTCILSNLSMSVCSLFMAQ